MKQYAVQGSEKDPYTVTVDDDGLAHKCTCMGFRTRAKCKHLGMVEADPSQYPELGKMPTTAQAEAATLAKKPLPMLAKTWERGKYPIVPGRYVAEEKYDGHRMLVRVGMNGSLTAWSRTGIACEQKIAKHMQEALCLLPVGVYDGELVVLGKAKSSNTSKLENRGKLTFVVFDLLEHSGFDITGKTYTERRQTLTAIFAGPVKPGIMMSKAWLVRDADEVGDLFTEIRNRGGEGLIFKRLDARYAVGKRSDAFLKLKEKFSAVLTIIGYEEGTTGPYCVFVLQDKEGNGAKVKVMDDELRARVNKDPQSFLGRELRIDYTERTEDSAYLQPRGDRLEDE